MTKYIVKLTEKEKEFLMGLTKKGRIAAHKLKHTHILLRTDTSSGNKKESDVTIAKSLHTSQDTVQRVRQRFVEEGLNAALERRKHKRFRPKKLDGDQEAWLIAKCCGSPPEGRTRWTLRLLADTLVREEIVPSIAPETVRLTLGRVDNSHR